MCKHGEGDMVEKELLPGWRDPHWQIFDDQGWWRRQTAPDSWTPAGNWKRQTDQQTRINTRTIYGRTRRQIDMLDTKGKGWDMCTWRINRNWQRKTRKWKKRKGRDGEGSGAEWRKLMAKNNWRLSSLAQRPATEMHLITQLWALSENAQHADSPNWGDELQITTHIQQKQDRSRNGSPPSRRSITK